MKKLFLILLAFVPLASVAAEKSDQVSRYVSVKAEATPDQKKILNVIIQVHFDDSVVTVGDAIRRLLRRSGYRLADIEQSSSMLPVFLGLKLPDVHRSIGPIQLKEGLQVLAGPAWRMVIDPVIRLVSFELSDEYQDLYKTTSDAAGNAVDMDLSMGASNE